MFCSPLDRVHRDLGAKMTEFGGWDMPLQYPAGTIAEHLACRRSAVVFDVSHLGSVRVTGAEAHGLLQRSFTNDLSKISVGRAQYTHLLDENGSVVDDIIVWWVGDDDFLVMPNASNTSRVLDAVGGRDVTKERALIALQGPTSKNILTSVWGEDAWVPRFRVRDVQIGSTMCTIAGTGYTGESGVEIHVPVDAAEEVWNSLTEAGAAPAGLGARDTLRLEAALPLYGHELGPGITPLQADLEWVVAWNKGDFIGRSSLVAEKESGVPRRLFGVSTEGRRPPRSDSEVFVGDAKVGVVTSGNYSPILEHGIALALLDPRCTIGLEVTVTSRNAEIAGTVVERPFVSTGK